VKQGTGNGKNNSNLFPVLRSQFTQSLVPSHYLLNMKNPSISRSLEKALSQPLHPAYDVSKSYEWNYRNGPVFKGPYPPKREKVRPIRLLDFEIASPLGIAAGPLLNSEWIRVYAKLGFDILTYKTVRTRRRPSNPKPNCVFVDTGGPVTPSRLGERMTAGGITPEALREITITNSFGVPSRNPGVWQEDVARARRHLNRDQLFVVSVMGSSEAYPDLPSFVRDFAVSAKMAKEAGAQVVELDLSCPNSNAAEGMVFMDPDLSGRISKEVKSEIGETPLFIKVGFFPDRAPFEAVMRANAPHVDGIVGINTVRMTVLDREGRPAIAGRPQSGVCGAGIQPCALQFVRWLVDTKAKNRYDFAAIGVGGIMTPDDVDEFLSAGVEAVEVATAAMWDPYLALRYRISHP
jgi:dihydroorotate dehydrogenase (NAD+) catalytic subunit